MFLKTEIFFLRFQKYPDTCGSHGHKRNRLVFTKYSKLCAFQITAPTLAIEQHPIKFCEVCSLRGKCLKVTESNGRKEEWGAGGGGEGRKRFLSPRVSSSRAQFFHPLLRVLQALRASLATLECERQWR